MATESYTKLHYQKPTKYNKNNLHNQQARESQSSTYFLKTPSGDLMLHWTMNNASSSSWAVANWEVKKKKKKKCDSVTCFPLSLSHTQYKYSLTRIGPLREHNYLAFGHGTWTAEFSFEHWSLRQIFLVCHNTETLSRPTWSSLNSKFSATKVRLLSNSRHM